MKSVLLEYLEQSEKRRQEQRRTKPVITLSRAFGCPAKDLALELLPLLEARTRKQGHDTDEERPRWSWVSKSIIAEAAQELELDPEQVAEERHERRVSLLGDLLHSFSSHYVPTTEAIRQTIAQVVGGYAEHGYVVMIGRGAEIITRARPNTFHLRLVAPEVWRVERTMEQRKLAFLDEAYRLVRQQDMERAHFRESFADGKNVCELFDMQLDASRFTVPQMAELVMLAMDKLGVG
jgi:cytidylate kinase